MTTREICEKKLSSTDSVLEPNVLETLAQYLSAGGMPDTAVQLLSANYRGLPHMAMLLSDWLKMASADEQPAGISGQGGKGAVKKEETGVTSAVVVGAPVGEPSAQAGELDLVYFLKQLLLERFDPNKADAILSGSSRPQWLDFLRKDPQGHALVYQLTEAHRNCLLLSYLVSALYRSGCGREIAAASSATASAYFDVFHPLLLDRLKDVCAFDPCGGTSSNNPSTNDNNVPRTPNQPGGRASHVDTKGTASGASAGTRGDTGGSAPRPDASSPSSPGALVDGITRLCCHSQHTYLYAQMLLQRLSKVADASGANSNSSNAGGSWGGVFRRLGQELEERALAERGAVVYRLGSLFVGGGAEADVATCMTNMLLEGSTIQGDVLAIYRKYQAADPPPVTLLRHPRFLGLLVAEIFTPRRATHRWGSGGGPLSQRREHVWLLALAVAAVDHRVSGGALDTCHVDATVAALDGALRLLEGAASGSLPSNTTSHMGSMGSSMHNGHGGEAEEDSLLSVLELPVCAMGVVHWVRTALSDVRHYGTVHQAASTPAYLELLTSHTLAAQPHLQGTVLDVLAQSLAAVGRNKDVDAISGAEARCRLVAAAVSVLTLASTSQQAEEALDFLTRHTGVGSGATPALAQHGLFAMLGETIPPYSAMFLRTLVSMAEQGGMIPGDGKAQGPGPAVLLTSRPPPQQQGRRRELLLEFAAWYTRAELNPPLGASEAQSLSRLCSVYSGDAALPAR